MLQKEEVKKILYKIKHPAINSSLIDLGIIKNFNIEEKKIKITLAFPFPDIPIKGMIIQSIENALKKTGLKVETEIITMDKKTLQQFLNTEQKNWKGM